MDSDIFIVLGMPRAGTTFLYHTLGKHPDIYMPYRKESMYFSVNYCKGEEWYRGLYKDCSPNQIGADVNPLYYIDTLAIDRILDFNPNTKVILSVRNPLDFAISQHGNIAAMGWDVPSVLDMVDGYQWQLSKDTAVPMHLNNGFMQRRIKEISKKFGDNALIYDFRYFEEYPLSVLKHIESFLEIAPFFQEDNFDNVKINASQRRNIPLLNSLLTSQGFLETIYKLVPDNLIRRGRTLFDKLSVSSSTNNDSGTGTLSDSEFHALEQKLESDIFYYKELFAPGPIQSGSGMVSL